MLCGVEALPGHARDTVPFGQCKIHLEISLSNVFGPLAPLARNCFAASAFLA